MRTSQLRCCAHWGALNAPGKQYAEVIEPVWLGNKTNQNKIHFLSLCLTFLICEVGILGVSFIRMGGIFSGPHPRLGVWILDHSRDKQSTSPQACTCSSIISSHRVITSLPVTYPNPPFSAGCLIIIWRSCLLTSNAKHGTKMSSKTWDPSIFVWNIRISLELRRACWFPKMKVEVHFRCYARGWRGEVLCKAMIEAFVLFHL